MVVYRDLRGPVLFNLLPRDRLQSPYRKKKHMRTSESPRTRGSGSTALDAKKEGSSKRPAIRSSVPPVPENSKADVQFQRKCTLDVCVVCHCRRAIVAIKPLYLYRNKTKHMEGRNVIGQRGTGTVDRTGVRILPHIRAQNMFRRDAYGKWKKQERNAPRMGTGTQQGVGLRLAVRWSA